MSGDLVKAEIAAELDGLPGLGDPGYTPEIHRQRTAAFAAAYDAPAEADLPEANLPEYQSKRHLDPGELAQYAPPEGLAASDVQLWDAIRPVALEAGVEPAQLETLTTAAMKFAAEQYAVLADRAVERAEAELKKQWGASYGQVVSDAHEFLLLEATPSERRALEIEVAGAPGLQIGSLPSVVNLLAKAGRAIKGAGPMARHGGGAMPAAAGGKDAVMAQIRELEKKHPIGARTKVQDAEIRRLYEQVYPGDAQAADWTRNGMGSLNRG